jgi:PadR family transcriptional regulator, regulatory protein PadR
MAVARVDVVVLGLLAEEPLYGYELIERYRSRAMDSWAEVGRASVYQALHRLERDGLVSGKAQGGREGPDRRVYRVTRPGRDRLHQGLLERFGRGSTYQSEAGAAFGWSHLLSSDEAKRGMAEREATLSAAIDRLADDRSRLQAAKGPANALARRMVDLQESLVRAEMSWLSTFRRDLSRLRR